MKDFSELIKTRRSMRQFTEELLSGDDVKLLLRAGLMAPSSKGLHSYEFIVVEDKQMYLNSSLKLSDIASELGVHQNEVSACINSNKGSSFSQFVNGYRIDYAKQLILRQPELKMSVVAEQSGFASESVFFRTFKSFVGATPKEWAGGGEK